MPEPLKNLYNEKFLNSLCVELEYFHTGFDSRDFTNCVFYYDWNNKELKERMKHIPLGKLEKLCYTFNTVLLRQF